ncbi:hypothetical protein Q5H92_13135 [Hymenobacter sp. M29]|uniref:DUF3108 domain-containing protein n=1 Tax=Hymenobacter mellowenesis TaxID=3063995 RepID=A0ABT9ADS4_9BACT|nr:hypothetical protein [Hymenobacter sp. M29]MDO7847310.1 hypothetical protein [Hymenobacter sp. M29]
MQRLYFLLLLVTMAHVAFADEPRSRDVFTSVNGQYAFRLTDTKYTTIKDGSEEYRVPISTTWKLFQQSTGQTHYSVTGFFDSKTVYVANDGRSLAVVDDWSEANAVDTLEVVSFYRLGEKIKAYRLADLLCSSFNISESASHFDWLPGLAYHAARRELVLNTYELNTLTFDATSGVLRSRVRHPMVTKTALLVYGEVKKAGADRYELTVCTRIFGKVPADGKVRFTSKRKYLSSYVTVLLDQGQHLDIERISNDWLLNECTYRLEQLPHSEQLKSSYVRGRKLGGCP